MITKLLNCLKRLSKWSFFHWDHLAVCLMMALFGWLLILITSKVSIFDPVKAAFDDFSMTDVFFDIHNNRHAELNRDIVIVDMTKLESRNDIAQVIMDIKSCHPKVLGIDLIFERPSFDQIDDIALISAIESTDCPQILSCKLRDFDQNKKVFNNCLYSFFQEFGNFNWGYTNYHQNRMGGVTRKTTQTQSLKDSTFFSFPYLLACYYMGKQPILETVNEREIMYSNVRFHIINSTEVLQHKDVIKDKLVLLGTISEEADMHFTPIGKISGVQVVAYSVLSYMNGGTITRMSKLSSLLLSFMFCFLAAWMGYKIEKWNSVFFPILAKIFNFGLGVILIGVALYLFVANNYYIDLLYPLIGLGLVEEVRVLYVGIIKWFVKKKKIGFLKHSLYAEM